MSSSVTNGRDDRAVSMNANLGGSSSEYGIRRKKHLDLIKQLRAIGAQADLDLPRITVIGNQSAGKSSLVEAISGISVPRDAGTCTRCPMECRLASSVGEWSCQVYIRWEFDGDGKLKDDVQELPFGPLIRNKSEVELVLRQAQCAVLNPQKAMSRFWGMKAEDIKAFGNKLPFSANTVCLDLAGPDLTDLAFVDLPGIIQNAAPETVQMVEDLVMSHITGNCLILVTIPMSDDIENQKAVRLAKQVDPTGQRTIGVLTKPDTLTSGALKAKQLWLDVLEGTRFKTTHGYYCTRQPDDDERTRGISIKEAREAERNFFKTTTPWHISKEKHRFGTDALIQNLARILSHIIDETLPTLQREVSAQHAECTSALDKLPPPITSDPSSFVLNLVLDFSQDVKRLVEGNINAPKLIQDNRRAYGRYKRNIRDSALLFLPYINASEEPTLEARHLFSSWDEEEVINIEDYGGNDTEMTTRSPQHMYLVDVREYIRNAQMRELPDNVPYTVKVALIRRSQGKWETLSKQCFDAVQATFSQILEKLVLERFSRYDKLRLRMTQFVKELMKKREDTTFDRITGMLELEQVPYTQNQHYLQETKAKYLALYKDARTGKLAVSTQPKSKRVKLDTNRSAHDAVSGATEMSDPKVVNIRGSPAPPMFVFGGAGNVNSAVSQTATPVKNRPTIQKRALSQKQVSFAQTKATPVVAKATPAFGKPAAPAKAYRGNKAGSESESSDSSSEESSDDEQSKRRPSTKRKVEAIVQPTRIAGGTEVDSEKEDEDEDEEHEQQENTAPAQGDAPKTQNYALDEDARAELERQALSVLASLGYNVTAADLGRLNGPDMYETELELMAEVRAYTQISYKRVIDNVPMTIDHGFLYGFANSLQEFLIERLALGTPGAGPTCASYLAEEPRIVALRDELMAKKRRLDGVQAELFNFGL